MKRDPAKRLRTRIVSYLTGKTPLRAFRRWFIPTYWNASRWAPPDLQRLVNQVDLYLIEYENGHRTEDALRKALAGTISSFEADLGVGRQPVRGTSSRTISMTTRHRGAIRPKVPPAPQAEWLKVCV
jgi:hypothetical protein